MNIFNSVKGMHPKRNKFTADTYRNDFTAPLGANIPCFWAEVPPATRIKVSASALVRLQALIAPVMDNIDYYTHFWKVPYRLLENDLFTQFISGEIEPEDYNALFCTPQYLAEEVISILNSYGYISTSSYDAIFGNGSLLDFLGYDSSLFPTVVVGEVEGVQALVIDSPGNNKTTLNWRGLIVYYMIHLNWYMNENVPYYDGFTDDVQMLVKEQSVNKLAILLVRGSNMFNSGEDSYSMPMLPHAWDKDYFTGALPNVQYGEPVTLPMAGTAPVSITGGSSNVVINDPVAITQTAVAAGNRLNLCILNNTEEAGYSNPIVDSSEEEQLQAILGEFNPKTSGAVMFTGSADLSEASALTINELRFANALQVFKERQMRFGRRRLEYYKGFFDVEPEDLRLQVPKYLGGGRIPINIADIEQTSETNGSSALGQLAGKATAVAGGYAGFSTFCSEETYIIGISFAIPHVTYAQQLSRFRMKTNDPYDYFNASFEHLGEQAIKNIEIYAGANRPDGDFGYIPRYTEYRFHSNEMHGEFKDTLAFWSLGRIFDSQPALNAQFVYMQPRVFNRIFAVSNQPNMIVSMLFHTRAIKPVSKYGTPMLLA